jgi:hypothetical protein
MAFDTRYIPEFVDLVAIEAEIEANASNDPVIVNYNRMIEQYKNTERERISKVSEAVSALREERDEVKQQIGKLKWLRSSIELKIAHLQQSQTIRSATITSYQKRIQVRKDAIRRQLIEQQMKAHTAPFKDMWAHRTPRKNYDKGNIEPAPTEGDQGSTGDNAGRPASGSSGGYTPDNHQPESVPADGAGSVPGVERVGGKREPQPVHPGELPEDGSPVDEPG